MKRKHGQASGMAGQIRAYAIDTRLLLKRPPGHRKRSHTVALGTRAAPALTESTGTAGIQRTPSPTAGTGSAGGLAPLRPDAPLKPRSEQNPARTDIWQMVEGLTLLRSRASMAVINTGSTIFQAKLSKLRRTLDTMDLEELPDSRERTSAPVLWLSCEGPADVWENIFRQFLFERHS